MSDKGSQGRGGKEKEKKKMSGRKGKKEKERSKTIFPRVGDPQAQIVLSA